MPQLDSSTFASQLFWLFISFFSLFAIAKFYIVPKVDGMFLSREHYVGFILEQAKEFAKEAEKIDSEVAAELESARMTIESEERNAIANIRANLEISVQAIHNENLQKSAKAIDEVNRYVEIISNDILTEMPKLVEAAYYKLYYNKSES